MPVVVAVVRVGDVERPAAIGDVHRRRALGRRRTELFLPFFLFFFFAEAACEPPIKSNPHHSRVLEGIVRIRIGDFLVVVGLAEDFVLGEVESVADAEPGRKEGEFPSRRKK